MSFHFYFTFFFRAMPHIAKRLTENHAGLIYAPWTPETPTIFIKLMLQALNFILIGTKELARADLTSGLTSWACDM